MIRRRNMVQRKLLVALAVSVCMAGAEAQVYPERPIHMVVPFPAGSITDVVTRILTDHMARDLGQPFVIENKAGANGMIGMQAAARSKSDGYTLVIVGVTTAASNLSLFKKVPYDPEKDFMPLGGIAETPYLLVGSNSTAANNVGELFVYGRQNPGKLTYGYGSGSARVFGAKLAAMGKMEVTDVGYRGGPQALADVMGGNLDLTFTDFANGLEQARAGKVRTYGVSTRNRFSLAPDIPTLDESGAPGFDLTVWFGLMAPTGVPDDVTQRLTAALDKALASQDLVKRFAGQGLTVKTQSPTEFGAFVNSEIVKWAEMVKELRIQPE